jgi:hypothetical protein
MDEVQQKNKDLQELLNSAEKNIRKEKENVLEAQTESQKLQEDLFKQIKIARYFIRMSMYI